MSKVSMLITVVWLSWPESSNREWPCAGLAQKLGVSSHYVLCCRKSVCVFFWGCVLRCVWRGVFRSPVLGAQCFSVPGWGLFGFCLCNLHCPEWSGRLEGAGLRISVPFIEMSLCLACVLIVLPPFLPCVWGSLHTLVTGLLLAVFLINAPTLTT